MSFIVATYVYASSQGQRTHSARTKIVRSSLDDRQRLNSNCIKDYCGLVYWDCWASKDTVSMHANTLNLVNTLNIVKMVQYSCYFQ